MGLYDRDYYQESEVQSVGKWNSRSIVTTLIIVNVAVQLLDFLGRNHPVVQYLWVRPDDLTQPLHWYRFLTYGFAHSRDIMHLVFNMLGLYMLGQPVEQKYGRYEFLRIYLVSLVLCSVVWAVMRAVTGQSSGVLLGASGAVTTISMLFVFSFPQTILHIWGIIPVRAWVIGVIIVVLNLMGSSRVDVGNKDQVAYDVHLTGAALAAIYFFGKLDLSALALLAAWPKRLWKRSPKLKIHRPESSISQSLQLEADRILEKLHRQGQDSLSPRERATLEQYSREVRKHRQQS
jgi:membrane associated rhomboid family serine protease